MHLHLDPLGGIAGDMFAAALIDLRPHLAAELQAAFDAAGLSGHVRISAPEHRDRVLTGHRFRVDELSAEGAPEHHAWRDIRAFLAAAPLASPVLERALAIFGHLAQAEAQVHGVPVEDVSFHEVGAWDSIADVVAAAWLIEAMPGASWSCAPLPLGSGRITTAHGPLPVPAPATTILLEGYPVYQDGIPGERITPTGAAILRHLAPGFSPADRNLRLAGSGMGFGTKRLQGISNVLRVLAFDEGRGGYAREQIVVCQFEVDDQTPEDLAVALEALRGAPSVLDVVQATVVGKKGRLGTQIQLLARPEALEETLTRCFTETSTLGVRWQTVGRAVLDREARDVRVGKRRVGVKRAYRPGGIITAKADMDDLTDAPGGLAGRERQRRAAEGQATTDEDRPRGKGTNEG